MRTVVVVAFVVLLFCESGFASEKKNSWSSPEVPPTSKDFWKPPAGEPPKLTGAAPFAVSTEIQQRQNWTLADLLDVALLTSNTTRASWNAAKAAAAEFNSKKGAYYPQIDLEAPLSRIKGSAIGGRFTFQQDSFAPNASLSYVLFNFGKREGEVDEARQALVAADWTHNAEIQNVILEVHQAYFAYLGAKALLLAQEANVKRAETNLDAARQRHQAGLATVADELQAQTSLSQAQLDVDTTKGTIEILRGTLATAIGIPPSKATFEVVDELPAELPIEGVSKDIQTMILQGFANRPDLASLRSEALKAQAHIRNVRGEGLPSIETNGSVERLYYLDPGTFSNNYSASLFVRFTLFDGFSKKYNLQQAKAEADAAKADVASLQQQIGLQIWTSYNRLNTSGEKIKTTQTLVQSAQQSYDVALGRYKEGVGSILDLLAAQNALENAKAQEVVTRTEWLLAIAGLAHDMGILNLQDPKSMILINPSQNQVNQ